jgi:tetratricopeptide (TPR) repeat protein
MMKTHTPGRIFPVNLFFVCLIAILFSRLDAQQNSGNGGQSGGDPLLSSIQRTLSAEDDMIDLEEGVVRWKGRTFSVGNSRIMRARFERYLSSPGVEGQVRDYEAVLRQIMNRLSVEQGGVSEVAVRQAWNLLFQAADYDIDDGASLVIANQVYNAWRLRDETRALRLSENELNRLRRAQEEILSNRGRQMQYRAETDPARVIAVAEAAKALAYEGDGGLAAGQVQAPQQPAQGGNNQPQPQAPGTQQQRPAPQPTPSSSITVDPNVEVGFRVKDLLITEGQLAASEAQRVLAGTQAKLQFQSQLVNFLAQRRFQHAQIGASFYRMLFRGTAQELQVGRSQMQQMLPDSDFTPTVDTIEFIAREGLSEVNSAMRTIETLYDSGEYYTALERLQEVFFLGEYTPAVLQFDPAKRRVLLEVYRDARDVQRLMDLKDYAGAIDLLNRLTSQAADFPVAALLTVARSAQQASNLQVMSARQAIAMGDTEKAETALTRAAEIWPLNPAVSGFAEDVTFRTDVAAQAGPLFDQLYERQDYRQIYERGAEFGAGLLRDEERSEKLRDVISRVSRIDMAIAYAEEAVAQNNPYAAWETLEEAMQQDPDDPVLARARSRLAPQVANFASRLDAAQRAEERQQWASSLNLYLSAQEIFPVSKICRQGIERTSAKLMERIAARN